MIVIICNEFSEFQRYVRARHPAHELAQAQRDYTYCTCKENVQQIQSINVTEFRIIVPVYWFSIDDWIGMMRRMR